MKEQQRIQIPRGSFVKFSSVKPDIDDLARLYLDNGKYVLRLDKQKMERIRSKSKETFYLTGSIEIEHGTKQDVIDIYHFSSNIVNNDLILASVSEIRLNKWVTYGLSLRLQRLRGLICLNPAWDGSLEEIYSGKINADESHRFLKQDSSKGMGALIPANKNIYQINQLSFSNSTRQKE